MLSMVSLGGWAATAWSSKAFRTLATAGVLLAGVWWFHSWSVNLGRERCEAEDAAQQLAEADRQTTVIDQALESAQVRAANAERLLRETQALANEAREAARGSTQAGHVCFDQETVNALRAIR